MLPSLADGPVRYTSDEFPFVLSAGERRSSTANTIYRDPTWRKRDPAGTLRISPIDAERLGLDDGGLADVVTRGGRARATVEVTDMMRAGHVSLPNGFGLRPTSADGPATVGVAPNELTTTDHADPIMRTPFHKHTPARIERVG